MLSSNTAELDYHFLLSASLSSTTRCPRFGYWTNRRVWRAEHRSKNSNYNMHYKDFYAEDGIAAVDAKTREKKHNMVVQILSVSASTRIITSTL